MTFLSGIVHKCPTVGVVGVLVDAESADGSAARSDITGSCSRPVRIERGLLWQARTFRVAALTHFHPWWSGTRRVKRGQRVPISILGIGSGCIASVRLLIVVVWR